MAVVQGQYHVNVIYSLGAGHTHTHTHAYRHCRQKQFQETRCMPGLKNNHVSIFLRNINLKYISTYSLHYSCSVLTYVPTSMVQVTLILNARKTCTHRKLACDTLVAYETHATPRIRKDMRVLAYMLVYCYVHATSTITCTRMVTTSKHLYKK